jgi:glycyl-tRNA synthetase beta chain
MVDFLLELGTEEIPAFYIEPAVLDLVDRLTAALDEAGLPAEGSRTAATPRRLAVLIQGLPEKQDDREEEVSGPPEKAAFDKDGKPTKAAVGFAKGQGAEVDAIEVRETPKGRYCFVTKKIAGRTAGDVLAEILPAVAAGIHFPKSMRWPAGGASGGVTFARPIRSAAAVLGKDVVRFAINNLESGRKVFGHPFMAPGAFELESADFDAYLTALRERHVIADVKERRSIIREGVEKILKGHGGALEEMSLVDEVTHLVEHPHVVEGEFDERFLELPAAVVKSAMMDHQRYFPVEDGQGKLLPRFITVINRGEEQADEVREGNERVLAARLADADFFLKEDRKKPLAELVNDLKGIVYQEKLGTYWDRVNRLKTMAGHLADTLALSKAERENCIRAAELCKCDLTTEMVGEFPNLQGVIGREYALMDGEADDVAVAIEEHYLPRFAGDRLPSTAVGKVLALAEKFDAVTGCFASGLSPTGSQDPYGLRRQALGILRIILEGGIELSLKQAVQAAAASLPNGLPAADIVESRVLDFFWDRLYHFCVERGFRYDLVKASLKTGYDDIHDFWKRLEALTELSAEPGWEELVTVVQRTYNIFKNAGDPGEVQEARLEEPEEKEVFRLYKESRPAIVALLDKADYTAASREYAGVFVKPVHTFFDKVFVNVDDEALKNNRLALMKGLNRLYTENIADLSQVVGE